MVVIMLLVCYNVKLSVERDLIQQEKNKLLMRALSAESTVEILTGEEYNHD